MGSDEPSKSGCFSVSSSETRELSAEEVAKLEKQDLVTEFKRNKLEVEAQKNWDKFYHRNKDNFFKDRNWSSQDLQGICNDIDFSSALNYLEAGCGVGNMLFPLHKEFPNMKLFAFDFSVNALQLLQKRAQELDVSVSTAPVDLSAPQTSSPFSELCDVATLIFVMSAIHPDKHQIAANNMRQFVKVGGSLIVRDYGANDYAMIRFGRGARLGHRFYARQDGTRAYYFELDELVQAFEGCGFRCVSQEYLHRKTVNLKKELEVPRIFVQCRFVRES